MNEHLKHGKTEKVKRGEFGKREVAITGTSCNNIKDLAQGISRQLQDLKIAFADAGHQHDQAERSGPLFLSYTDRRSTTEIQFTAQFNRYRRNVLFSEADLVLVNGNHFSASRQILVLDPGKTLDRKTETVTDPLMIIYRNRPYHIPETLRNKFPGMDDLPYFHIEDHKGIAQVIRKWVEAEVPPLYGLVLAGGKSLRMGKDKGLIEYFGKPHREYLYDLLSESVGKVFYSIRPGQKRELKGKPVVVDSISDLGPLGALISAFREHPGNAWLVVATDLPLVNSETIGHLIRARNPSKMATAFYNPATDFPEPLITIWEPKAFPVLLDFFGLGYSCPRKVLINSDIELLQPAQPETLINVNDPDGYESIRKVIRSGR